MDPITAALIIGATAALQETAGQVVKDAYAGFKAFLVSRFQSTKIAINALDENPRDKDTQQFVEAKVTSTNAANDADVLKQAKILLKLLKEQTPHAAQIVGVKFEDFDFDDALSIDGVTSTGDGVSIARGKAKGKVEIKNVQAGQPNTDPNA